MDHTLGPAKRTTAAIVFGQPVGAEVWRRLQAKAFTHRATAAHVAIVKLSQDTQVHLRHGAAVVNVAGGSVDE